MSELKLVNFSSIRTYKASLKYLQDIILEGKILPNPFDPTISEQDMADHCARLQRSVNFIKTVPRVNDHNYTAIAYDLEWQINEQWYGPRIEASIYSLSPLSESPLRFIPGTKAYQCRKKVQHIKRVLAKFSRIINQLPNNWKNGIPFDQSLSPCEKLIGLRPM